VLLVVTPIHLPILPKYVQNLTNPIGVKSKLIALVLCALRELL